MPRRQHVEELVGAGGERNHDERPVKELEGLPSRALGDAHTLARDMVVDLVHPGAGDIKALGVPVKLSDTPGGVDRAAPMLGQDNAAILTELGYSEAEQRTLADQRVI